MNYSYGFALADFDCDQKPDVSFFDSFSTRVIDRSPHGVVGYVAYSGLTLDRIVPIDDYPDMVYNGLYLFERHVPIDINGDGFQDIAGVLNSHDAVVAYINSGRVGEAWTRRYLSKVTPGPVNIASGDIDLDGDIDLAVTMRRNSDDPEDSSSAVAWLENPGTADGAWPQHTIGKIDFGRSLVIADMTGDGNADVIASDNSTGEVILFAGNRGQAWVKQVLTTQALHGHFGVAIDVNGDGMSEVLQPVYRGIKLAWLDQTTGVPREQRLVTFEAEAGEIVVTEVAAADIDGDGRMDIVFTVGSLSPSPSAPRRGGVYWLRQTETSWEVRTIDPGRGSVVAVQIVDMDGDGDTDIVSDTEYPANAVTLHTNPTR